jgi:competence protein ComEC
MQIFIFLILFFKMSIAESPNYIHHWVIWNVGQGQWITEVKNESCTHFDFGGEISALKKIKPLYNQNCRYKINKLYLSHADWDHYAFYNFIIKNNIKTCWKLKPREALKKLNIDAPYCTERTINNPIEILFYDQTSRYRNETSTVLLVKDFLIPGDSPTKQEKKWIKNIPEQNTIKFLVLGHHGSRTSTSQQLLKQLPLLKMAFVTSRFKKYGHPHADVVRRLKDHHLTPVKTESWGTVLIL